MKKVFFGIFLFLNGLLCFSQSSGDTLVVSYYGNNRPFSYNEGNEVKGVEADIMREYVLWLKTKKNISLHVKYAEYKDFNVFYNTIKTGNPKNQIGMGSVTILAERTNDVDFSTGYLKNLCFCVTNGHAPDIKSKNSADILKVLGSMTALTMQNTSLSKYVNDLKTNYIKDLKISYMNDEIQIVDKISSNPLYFGYVDAVVFWSYLKTNPHKVLKTQRVLSKSEDYIGFIMPKGSKHKALFGEFFTTFKTTDTYREMLETHLGTYMTQNMMMQ